MKLLLIISILMLQLQIYSQVSADSIKRSGYYDTDREAKEAVAKILMYTGLEPNFTIKPTNLKSVKNVITYVKGTKRYIEYNPDFIKDLKIKSQTNWAAVSVLAHEIGHHLLGHTLDFGKTNPGNELETDKFSGFILNKMGAKLDETIAAIETVGHTLDTIKHPPKSARILAIKSGWEQSEMLKNIKAYQADSLSDTHQDINLKYKCSFKGDENTYFIDDNDSIIWFDNYGKPIVFGHKSNSDKPAYKWIYTYSKTNYYVDGKGDIWNITLYGSTFKVGRVEMIK